jgi:hypothetical protein
MALRVISHHAQCPNLSDLSGKKMIKQTAEKGKIKYWKNNPK